MEALSAEKIVPRRDGLRLLGTVSRKGLFLLFGKEIPKGARGGFWGLGK